MLCPADDPNPGNYHSYVLNHHLMEHNIRYSSRLPAGLTTDHAVVAGEKKTTETYYFIETFDGPPPNSSYDQEIEIYRHGVGLGSNDLYLDMHVDSHGPVDTLYGLDPWDLPTPPTTLPTN
jgi:hypothetical protein